MPVELLTAPLPDARLLVLSDALDAADALGVSAATADRMWAYARARLKVTMGGG